MSVLEKILAKKELKSSLERVSKLETIDLKSIRFKFTYTDGLRFFIMNGVNTVREDDIYILLKLNPDNSMHKNIISRVEKKLMEAIVRTAIEKKLLQSDIDARFYLAKDDKERLTKLSMYLFHQNSAHCPLNIDDYF